MIEHVQAFIERLFASSELNRLPEAYGGAQIFAKSLMGISRGDDDIFQKFKEVVAPEHLTPVEMWVQSGLPADRGLAARLRIVSIVFPYINQIREAGRRNDQVLPPEVYSVAYNFANPFVDAVLQELVGFFQKRGFQAISGIQSKVYQYLTRQDPFLMYSNWSERHVAFAAGLGTFSLHEGLITEMGCNIRVASVITDAPLKTTDRINDQPYANCLHFANGTCEKCAEKCPAGAITSAGHNKRKCFEYGKKVIREMHQRPFKAILKPRHRKLKGKRRVSYPVGCALCQFDVPCSNKNPVGVFVK